MWSSRLEMRSTQVLSRFEKRRGGWELSLSFHASLTSSGSNTAADDDDLMSES